MKKILLIAIVLCASCSKDKIHEIESTQEPYFVEIYDISKLEGLWQIEQGNAAEQIRIENAYFIQGSSYYTMNPVNERTIKLTEEIRNRYQKLYTEIDVVDSDTITVYYYSNDEGNYLYRKNYIRN